MERRTLYELRSEGDTITGYAAVYGARATLGSFTESIAPGAFSESIAKNDIIALLDHDVSKLLGRTRTGSLVLRDDLHGLAFELALPSTTTGRDVAELAKRGDLGGASLGFYITGEQWRDNHRTLTAVDLREISIVSSWPAYGATTVKARGRSLALARRWMETT